LLARITLRASAAVQGGTSTTLVTFAPPPAFGFPAGFFGFLSSPSVLCGTRRRIVLRVIAMAA